MRFVLLSALAAIPLVASTLVLRDPNPLFTTTSPAGAAPTCVADDLLRLLRANGREARPYCRSVLGLESTSIVATVAFPAVTAVVTETITSTHLQTLTITNVETTITTVVETVVVETQTITTTSAAPVVTPSRRLRRDVLSAINGYPPASVFSACRCLNVKMCGKKATATLPAATETSVAGTVTVDATEIETATEVATTTVVTTVTEAATATSVAVVEPRPTTFPTGLFRLVSKGLKGEKVYFRRSNWYGSGDVLYLTTNSAEAVSFGLDAQRRLYFTSPGYSAPVYANYQHMWFPPNTDTAFFLIFNPEAAINTQLRTIYQFDVDWETLAIFPSNAPTEVSMMACVRDPLGTNALMLHVGRTDVNTLCTWITIFLEFD